MSHTQAVRRTFTTGLQRLKIPVEVAEQCLNHKSGTRDGVAGIYARYEYLQERTAALEAWARHVDSLVNTRSAEKDIPVTVTA